VKTFIAKEQNGLAHMKDVIDKELSMFESTISFDHKNDVMYSTTKRKTACTSGVNDYISF
jgi:hypothetical protein